MSASAPARTTTRRIPRILVVGLLVVIAAVAALLGYQSLAPSSSTAASPRDVLRSEHRGALGEADGAVPDGTTVFDDEIPAVANLDPALLGVLRRAATDAADDGVEFFVDSGWRSAAYQEQLLHEAASEYGSEEEAARWVAAPNTSAHVSGDAVDIGSFDATAWLSEYGAKYELCQIYSNEPWHYELRPEAIAHGCPPMYADPTRDPRMQAVTSTLGHIPAQTRRPPTARSTNDPRTTPPGQPEASLQSRPSPSKPLRRPRPPARGT
jgi:zinc D-Ala-D-Ala carboxypeptidase